MGKKHGDYGYQKLKTLRAEKRYTNKDMAEKIGISKAFYCQIENQTRRLTYEMAIRIADVFHTKPDKIFYEEAKNELHS